MQEFQGSYTIAIVQVVASGQSTLEDFAKAQQAVERSGDQDSDLAKSFAEAASVLEPQQ
jgi:hypothetical protein